MDESRELSSSTLDVVVAMRNGRRHLPGLIKSIKAQVQAPSKVVVVDDGSSDGSVDYLRQQVPSWVIRSTDSVGPAGARNTGARAGTSDWLLFVDVDDLPRPDWCSSFLQAASGQALLLRRGVVMVTPTSRREAHPEPGLGGCFLVGSWAVTRTLWEEVQGYDSRYRYSENTDLALRLRRVLGAELGVPSDRELILDGRGVDIMQAESARARNTRHAEVRRAAVLRLLQDHMESLTYREQRDLCRVAFSTDLRSGRYDRLPADAWRMLRHRVISKQR